MSFRYFCCRRHRSWISVCFFIAALLSDMGNTCFYSRVCMYVCVDLFMFSGNALSINRAMCAGTLVTWQVRNIQTESITDIHNPFHLKQFLTSENYHLCSLLMCVFLLPTLLTHFFFFSRLSEWWHRESTIASSSHTERIWTGKPFKSF